MLVVALVATVFEMLCGCERTAQPAPPNGPTDYWDAVIVNVLVAGPRTQIWLDKGPADGVAVGDHVRLPCRADVGTVSKAFGRRSVAEIATGPLPDSQVARIGRAGAVPEPWCDAPAPNKP